MKKRKFEQKTIFTGRGQSILLTIAPNGTGKHNLIVEDDENILHTASDLHSRKDCEIAAALYLLMRNGLTADIYVNGGRREKTTTTIVKKERTTFNLVEPSDTWMSDNAEMIHAVAAIVQKSLTDNLSDRQKQTYVDKNNSNT